MGPCDFDEAFKEFNKKFKDKSGHKWEDRTKPAKKGKYTFLERSYEDDDDAVADAVKKEEDEQDEEPRAGSKLPRQTQRLMELIFNQNHFNAVLEQIGYNANKLPLGKLSKSTLKQGFEHLHELASLIKHPNLAQNKYGTSQKDVSSSTRPLQWFGIVDPMLMDANDRRSRTSPISITPPFLTNSAGTGLQRSTTTSASGPRSQCLTH